MPQRQNTRQIEDILYFREDISPFLIHLTRDDPNDSKKPAKVQLTQIIHQKKLICGKGAFGDARYCASKSPPLNQEQLLKYFSAICLTETPLNEIHCLLEIARREICLQPYGLAFLKDNIAAKYNVSPVHYYNNANSCFDGPVRALCSLIETHPEEAAKVLPLISVFNKKFTPVNAFPQEGAVDWRWEREWRLPKIFGDLAFDTDDVFVGLCPHEEIGEFEALFPKVPFIDPRRNMKWYSSSLVSRRQDLKMKYSVV